MTLSGYRHGGYVRGTGCGVGGEKGWPEAWC